MTRRYLPDAPVKDGHELSGRCRANFRRVLASRAKNQSRGHQMQQERHNYESSDDWRIILRMLDSKTTANPELYKKRLETVKLPEVVLAKFHSNAGASLREIMEHTGCHVQKARGVTHCNKVPEAFAGLDLLGSFSQITHALEILPQYLEAMPTEEMIGKFASSDLSELVWERWTRSEEDMRLASLSATTNHQQKQTSYGQGDVEHVEDELEREAGMSTSVTTPLRSTWVVNRRRPLTVYDVFDEHPGPLSTALDVSVYVANLCQRVPRELQRALYKKRMPPRQRGHVQVVMEKLVRLFSSPGIACMTTSSTVDRAIGFLMKHNNLAAFREMYKALEDGGYVFTASNWNCCLAGAAKVGDVHNFRYTLKVMLRHNVKPNPITWAALHDLVCRRFPQEASFVVNSMRRKGLLWDPTAAQLVTQHSVAHDLKAHLALGGNLTTFFRFYDNRFSSVYGLEGFNWLTVGVMNRIVAVLVSSGRIHDAFEMTSEFRRRNGKGALETVTLNTFLTSALRDMDPASAVAILQHFHIGQPGAIIPDNVTYTILFAIAWRRRYFNMLRVIWRYACASGQIGISTRYHITRNLNFFLSGNHDKSRGDVWRALAAKFAIGINGDLRHYMDQDVSVPDDSKLNVLETQLLRSVALGHLPKGSPLFEERRNLYRNVFNDDCTELSLSRPVLPLAELLKAAWEKDLDWKERGLGLPKNYNEVTFKEMLEDGIQVPMKAGDGTLETRSWEVRALLRQNSRVRKVYHEHVDDSKYKPMV